MTQKVLRAMGLFLCLMAMLSAVFGAEATVVIPHQGRLLDGSDVPVANGSYSITYGLYSDSTGGSPLWTETQTVTTSGGLFSTMLGKVTPLTLSVLNSPTLYLQMQVSGQPVLTPRLAIGTAPSAAVAKRVLGDVSTSPGSVRVDNASGTQGLALTADDSTGNIAISHQGANLVKISGGGGGGGGSIAIGDPGVNGNRLSMGADNTSGAGIAIDEPGVHVAIKATPDSTVTTNGRNYADHKIIHRDLAARNILMEKSSRVSGLDTTGQVTIQVDSSGAGMEMRAINTKGTGAVVRTVSQVNDSGASMSTLADLNGDGIPDLVASTDCDDHDAKMRVRRCCNNLGSSGQDGVELRASTDGSNGLQMQSLNGLPPGTPVFGNIAMSTSSSTADIAVGDLNGDGLLDFSSSSSEVSSSMTHKLLGGISHGTERVRCSDGSCSIAIDEPGMHISQMTTPDSTVFDQEATVGARVMVHKIHMGSDGVHARMHTSNASDSSGIDYNCDGSDSKLVISSSDNGNGSPVITAITDSTGQAHLSIGNIGSSGQDGVEIDGHGGGGGGGGGGSISVMDGGAARVFIDASGGQGKIGIGTITPSEKLEVDGNICASGTIGACSDARYKTNVETIQNALELIGKLRGVNFEWKKAEFPEKAFADGKQVGFIAQEIKEVIPEVVSQGKDGYYSVDYAKLTPLLVEAVKQQQKTIEELQKKLADTDDLRAQVKQLSAMVEILMANHEDNASAKAKLASAK